MHIFKKIQQFFPEHFVNLNSEEKTQKSIDILKLAFCIDFNYPSSKKSKLEENNANYSKEYKYILKLEQLDEEKATHKGTKRSSLANEIKKRLDKEEKLKIKTHKGEVFFHHLFISQAWIEKNLNNLFSKGAIEEIKKILNNERNRINENVNLENNKSVDDEIIKILQFFYYKVKDKNKLPICKADYRYKVIGEKLIIECKKVSAETHNIIHNDPSTFTFASRTKEIIYKNPRLVKVSTNNKDEYFHKLEISAEFLKKNNFAKIDEFTNCRPLFHTLPRSVNDDSKDVNSNTSTPQLK